MPVHDWTQVEAGIFHAFHVTWVPEIQKALNGGLLPEGYYALAEQHAGPRWRTLAIRHVSGHRLIALVEIVSPANKDRLESVQDFVTKVVEALELGVHVLLLDLLPPGRYDPRGMHGAVWNHFDEGSYDLPVTKPLTAASYAAGPSVEAYLEHVAVGAALPEMPLFLRPDRYINVPLEPTYQAAYRGMPAFWRDVLEGRTPQGF